MKIKKLLKIEASDQSVTIKGWVRTKRGSKNISFIALNDGSTINNIQVVLEGNNFSEDLVKQITTGSSLIIEGILVPSKGNKQPIEVLAKKINVLGGADAEQYPLQPKKHSLEFLREKAHLRFRTNTFSAVFRLRHALTFAVHKFFNEKGFFSLHTPIITGTDAEGAGEMFQVTTLNLEDLPKNKTGNIDFTNDFFGSKTNLTVSGQLEAELGALGLGQVYTFGPTFRAENSNTSRHLSEFWMIEPELAFADLHECIDLAEEFVKYCIKYCIDHYADDLQFLNKRMSDEEAKLKKEDRSEMGLLERLQFVLENDFLRITYSEAIDILKNSKPNKKKKFKYLIDGFGADLQSEHERYLVEKKFKRPIVITDYPKEIKAFYMRINEDNKTVRAMDILFPEIGEIIGGSQREERLDKLKERMTEMDICEKELWWYLETRKFGTCQHSGFGLGFERLIMFVTGMKNIRDVIPFPRTPQNANF
ncbi:MAG: asparagine--tRNA ligase [Flavobacteriales bacterium]|nr:asparagine--tRNA ligase [Flavobacteriales bacterium]|tara:strand:+ start:87185 stop:88618 length:1434 start_codon:yes stop_codon:yes gene_type:complete